MTTALQRLKGKVALITGAASGIGECSAKLFAEHGAKVVVADVQDQLGHAVCDAIGSSNSKYVHCDVTNEADIQKAVDTTVAAYGKLDIMFCNAGLADPTKARVMDVEKKDVQRVLDVNVLGVYLSMKHAARVMVPARTGSIVSTGSLSSTIAGVGSHAYSSSKHAVVGLTKSLALELGQFGIRVNCVSPFALATPLATSSVGLDDEAIENMVRSLANLKGPTLKSQDVANAALFLVSEEAKYISGQNLVIDGGLGIANPSFGLFKYSDN